MQTELTVIAGDHESYRISAKNNPQIFILILQRNHYHQFTCSGISKSELRCKAERYMNSNSIASTKS